MKTWTKLLFCATALTGFATSAIAAELDETVTFNIAPGRLDEALIAYSSQADLQVISASADVRGKQTRGVEGATTPREALAMLLRDSGLSFVATSPSTVTVTQGESQAGGGAGATVEALIVTAQKREEDIQDVPIAISAFTQKDLDAQKIEGGFDLVKAIPNVSFTKTNFTSYNFQIRGIGTQATSATTDPGVAVAFNNTGVIQNRLFEQEYLDIERVEVLRGPQGTLYGRNATAGVINVITAKPRMGEFLGELKGELGNYNTARLRGMVNIPFGDTLAVRAAAAWTDRDGYTFNAGTGRRIDGRELWTGRLSVGWEPTPQLRADLIWEHFEEDDNRLRTGKQLCHRDNGPTHIGDVDLADGVTQGGQRVLLARRAFFTPGCKAGSLYDDAAFGTPNGLSYPFVLAFLQSKDIGVGVVGQEPGGGPAQSAILPQDPYSIAIDDPDACAPDPAPCFVPTVQSRDLREIASPRDPVYRASADLFQLNVDFDITDTLTLSSQTAYVEDETFSFQDFNRFVSQPVFYDTTQLGPDHDRRDFIPGGVFCDPQVGCSDTIAGFDIAQAAAEQFSHEFRLQSDFRGPVNFSLGVNYTEFETEIDYYVMFNLISVIAQLGPFNHSADPSICLNSGQQWDDSVPITSFDDPNAPCPFVDPNPVDPSRNFGTGGNGEGEGHNYFRSRNPYELESWAGFGELYWNIQDDLKLTAGLRYTDDTKTFTQIPTQTLLSPGNIGGGTVAKGYPVAGVIEQHWGEWTGRLVLDWQPVLNFTDETLLYASFSRGYKGGGANPPTPGFGDLDYYHEILVESGLAPPEFFDFFIDVGLLPILELTAAEYGDTFEAEFVNAYEIGAKNTLFGGGLTLNATGFYYDYKDYQVSQIRDRTAVNENFDATMWGLELETVFIPSENWRFLANIGYLNTEIADGETSIDIMNRTQGNPDYVLVKPWVQLPSNCVLPLHVAEWWAANRTNLSGTARSFCGGVGGAAGANFQTFDPGTGQPWDPLAVDADGNLVYPEINGGAGLLADLGGNDLPNSPHWTANVGGQYTFHLPNAWELVVRGDVYWQSQSYHRVYNYEPYDKLRAWWNANLSVWAENPDLDLTVEFYVKNLLNDDPITGAFLNSDDTGLTTNVFMLDPRLIGLSIRKRF